MTQIDKNFINSADTVVALINSKDMSYKDRNALDSMVKSILDDTPIDVVIEDIQLANGVASMKTMVHDHNSEFLDKTLVHRVIADIIHIINRKKFYR